MSKLFFRLRGSIPLGILHHQFIAVLSISSNELAGTINMIQPQLIQLALGENKLIGSFPACRRSSRLTSFLCTGNMLEGTLPANLMTPRLWIMDASGKGDHVSGLAGQLPPQASQAFALQHFTISRQNLEGCIPPLTATLSTLAFHSNRFSHFQSAHLMNDSSSVVVISAECGAVESALRFVALARSFLMWARPSRDVLPCQLFSC